MRRRNDLSTLQRLGRGSSSGCSDLDLHPLTPCQLGDVHAPWLQHTTLAACATCLKSVSPITNSSKTQASDAINIGRHQLPHQLGNVHAALAHTRQAAQPLIQQGADLLRLRLDLHRIAAGRKLDELMQPGVVQAEACKSDGLARLIGARPF